MITELLLIAAAGIINPMDMSGHSMYPSGVKECDKYPMYPYPASKLAKLTLPHPIISDNGEFSSKLTLVNLHNGRHFTDSDRQIISKIKQPVRQLKVFRLGIEKELSSNSKCITDSKWYKIK